VEKRLKRLRPDAMAETTADPRDATEPKPSVRKAAPRKQLAFRVYAGRIHILTVQQVASDADLVPKQSAKSIGSGPQRLLSRVHALRTAVTYGAKEGRTN
jgi:hypothetical protein